MTQPSPSIESDELAGRLTIDKILPSVAAAVGAEGFVNSMALPSAPRYVVLLVDGLGRMLLDAHAAEAPFLSSLTSVDDVVCGVPSTTATSLTSLGTGLRPGQHGMVGYTTRAPGSGQRFNLLTWDQPIDATVWQPHPTMLQRIHEAGVPTSAVNEAKFENTGLTLCSQRGVPFHGVKSVWERLDVILEVIESAPQGVVYAYESRLDHAGHRYGCTSQEWRDMLSTVDRELRELSEELPSDTVLLITADHGMLDLPSDGRFDVDDYPRLRDDVELIAGEARFRHLYTRPGTADDVARRWQEQLGDRAIVRTQRQARNWFGPIDVEVSPRIGDVLVAALGDFAVFSSRDFSIELLMTGFHGSVTEAELRIPVLLAHGSR